MQSCPSCETENSGLAKFCSNCGTPLPKKVAQGWITGSVLCSIIAVCLMFASYAIWFDIAFEDYSNQMAVTTSWEVFFGRIIYGMLHFVALPFLVVPLITLIKVAKSNKKLLFAPALLVGIYLISFAGCFGVNPSSW
ncbi:MAG: hypothetical protein CL786_03525 [Chloroflexi bacterium]|nr:hypothetical protein [Chloroflexota bacterium]